LSGAEVDLCFVALDVLSSKDNLHIAFKLHSFIFSVSKHTVGIK
jgi:hypothetical protein